MKIVDYKNLDQDIIVKAISAINVALKYPILFPFVSELGADLDFAKAIKERIDSDTEQMQQIKINFYNSLSEIDKKRVVEKDNTIEAVVLERRFKYKYTEKPYQDLKDRVECNMFALDGCYKSIQTQTIVIEEYLLKNKCNHPLLIEFTNGAIEYSNSISNNKVDLENNNKKPFLGMFNSPNALMACPKCGIKEIKPLAYFDNGRRIIMTINREYLSLNNYNIDDAAFHITNDFKDCCDTTMSESEYVNFYFDKFVKENRQKQFVIKQIVTNE